MGWILGFALFVVSVFLYVIVDSLKVNDPEAKSTETVWIGASGERVDYNEQTGKYKMLWP